MPKEASLAAMKHLSRKHKIALVELVVLVLLVVWFIAPRPLTRAMAGDGFDPAAVTQIQADLTAFQGGEGRTLTFSQEEPAFSQLMDLLQSKRYIPYYLDQDAQRSVTLGYRVDLTFSQGEASYTLSLTGDRAIVMGGDGGTKTYQVTDSDAFQQSVLDFLLEQEYTKEETP